MEKPNSGKKTNVPTSETGTASKRDQRSAPILQEQVDDKDHQHDGDQKGFNDLLHAFRNGASLVKRYGIIHVFREALLHLGHQLSDACGRLDRIGAGQLVDRNDRGGFAIQAADNAVVLSAQLDARDVFHANDSAIRGLADDDVSEFFRRSQTALSKNGIGELLVLGSRLAANLAGRVHRVLRLDGVDDLRHRDAQLRQLVGLDPKPHGILPCAENLHLADAVQACDRIVEVDVGVVGQELCIVSAVRRVQSRPA